MPAFLLGPVHGFMVWNSFLAAVPAVLALALFHRPRPRRPVWVAGFVVWLLFLPNAPYVCTDVTHMVDDLRRAASRFDAYVVLATYGAFFAGGLASYVLSMQLFRRFLHRVVARRLVAPILITVHGLCVVAIYLGRFVRLNSWDALLAPDEVLGAVLRVPRPSTIVVLAVTFVVIGAGAYAMTAVLEKVAAQIRRSGPARFR